MEFDNSKNSILQIVDFRESPLPFLLMPYFSRGNLAEQHSEEPIAVEETLDLLFQILNALQYLHSRGVAHRDLKSQNILVESRSPLSVKLADFGLANDKFDLIIICGIKLYTAPKIYSGGRYTVLVDIWSLGVIILEYMYGLPNVILQKCGQQNRPIMGLA